MKRAIILIILWILFVTCYIVWGDTAIFTDKQICDCIYIIEGKEKARQPYGIETIECKSKEYCEQICLNTVKNNRVRYKEYGYKQYKDYGGRGIKVKFTSFEDFYNHIINTIKIDPRGLTIDRIDNDGHYEKGNIRFVSRAENNRNKNHIAQIEKQSKKKTA